MMLSSCHATLQNAITWLRLARKQLHPLHLLHHKLPVSYNHLHHYVSVINMLHPQHRQHRSNLLVNDPHHPQAHQQQQPMAIISMMKSGSRQKSHPNPRIVAAPAVEQQQQQHDIPHKKQPPPPNIITNHLHPIIFILSIPHIRSKIQLFHHHWRHPILKV